MEFPLNLQDVLKLPHEIEYHNWYFASNSIKQLILTILLLGARVVEHQTKTKQVETVLS